MKFVWLQSSIWANRMKTIWLVLMFPILLFVVIAWVLCVITYSETGIVNSETIYLALEQAGMIGVMIWPLIFIWFLISFFFHRQLIFKFSWAKPLDRKKSPEVYNIVENLCISRWLTMPKIWILDDDSLNAFATWRKPEKSRIVFSRWIIDKLDKKEIEAVAAHELTHIINKDTLLMMVIIVFVGILWTLGEILMRSAGRSRSSNSKNSGKWTAALFFIGLALVILWYLIFPLIRLAISRKREYLADAWSVELTKDNNAMISALQKISQDARIESIKKQTVAAMCIETPFSKDPKTHKVPRYKNMLSTHPSIKDRIQTLKWY